MEIEIGNPVIKHTSKYVVEIVTYQGDGDGDELSEIGFLTGPELIAFVSKFNQSELRDMYRDERQEWANENWEDWPNDPIGDYQWRQSFDSLAVYYYNSAGVKHSVRLS